MDLIPLFDKASDPAQGYGRAPVGDEEQSQRIIKAPFVMK
jgi:hypothetical protein